MKRIVLKASAGTGKTYRLSLEYIGALLKGESFRNIFVMTFTKKATAEIEERILSFLSLLSSTATHREEAIKREELLSSLRNLYPEILYDPIKVKEIYREIVQNREKMRIFTIDGFINRIFKKVIAPYLNIETFNVIDSDEEYEISAILLEKIFSSRESFDIFKSFFSSNMEKNMENYISMITYLLNERWKYILLKEKYPHGIPKKEKISGGDSLENIYLLLEDIIQAISLIKDRKNAEKGNSNPISEFLKKQFTSYPDLDKKRKFEFIENSLSSLIENQLWNGNKVKGKAFEDSLSHLKILHQELALDLKLYIHDNKIIPYEEDVLNFLDELYRHYDKIKIQERKLTFNDISTYTYMYFAQSELGLIENGEVTDYFQELFDGKINTFFIDEFQDTSVLQWKILKTIAQKAENVYCVGDEKQSLYGWRGGEKRLFENLPHILSAEEETMNISYRSKKDLISYTNSVFEKISDLYINQEEAMETTWSFSPVDAKKTGDAYIAVMKGDEENGDTLDLVCASLKEKFHPNYNDVAVIARSNEDLRKLSLKLSDAGIPFVLNSKKNLFQHRANLAPYSFLKFLVYRDYFSLLEFMRTDSIGISDSDLKFMIESKEIILTNLYLDEFPSCDLTDTLEPLLKEVHSMVSLYRRCSGESSVIAPKLFKSFGISETFTGESDITNYIRFLEIAMDFKTVADLIKASEFNPSNSAFSQVSSDGGNSVSLLTIHASKGLEYDTVFFIHKQPRNSGSSIRLSFDIQLSNDFSSIEEFMILNESYRKLFDPETVKNLFPKYSFIPLLKFKELQEEINNWYVALTRAKNNLFIVYPEKSSSFLAMALENLDSESGLLHVLENKEESSISEPHGGINLDLSPKASFVAELDTVIAEQINTSLRKESKRVLGNAVHYFFENIRHLTPEEIQYSKAKTISTFGGELGAKFLSSILNSNEFKEVFNSNSEIFSEEWDHIHSEFEIKYLGERKRIDRIMIKEPTEKKKGEILIIDYKTGLHDITQLKEYEEAVKALLEEEGKLNDYTVKSRFMKIPILQGGGENQ